MRKESGRTHRVFVYGTLKKGYGNSYLLADAVFVGTAVTVTHCRMRDVGFPIIFRAHGGGMRVRGEVYLVNDQELAQLDRLESEGRMYRRVKIKVDNAGRICKAYAYVAIGQAFRSRGEMVAPTAVPPPTNWELVWRPYHERRKEQQEQQAETDPAAWDREKLQDPQWKPKVESISDERLAEMKDETPDQNPEETEEASHG